MHMHPMARLAQGVAFSAVMLGCAVQPIIVLSHQPDLVAGPDSKWLILCCERVPLSYQLCRARYVVDLVAFENGSAGLALQPKDLRGARLELRSSQPFMDAVKVGLTPDSWPGGYRYWVLPDWVSKAPFHFSVVDSRGRVLGSEELAYRDGVALALELRVHGGT
jgi:hypothetical protein